MRVTEAEIFLPFRIKPVSSRGNTLQTYAAGITSFGAGIFSIFHGELLLSIVLIATGIFLLISPVFVAWISKKVSRQFVRINYEGVLLAAILPTAVQWRDISTVTLSTWTYLRRPIRSLVFVPRNPERIITCIVESRSKNWFFSFAHDYKYAYLSSFTRSFSFNDFSSGCPNSS